MAIELHQRECDTAPSVSESLDVALRQLRLMESYLQRLLTVGTHPSSPEETIPLDAIVQEALELVRPACAHAAVELRLQCPREPLCARGDDQGLRQMVINLVYNAMEAGAANRLVPPRVVVELARLNGNRAVLSVTDTGTGPSAEVQDRLFEPFVTAKPEGTGLGLFVARQIAEAHHGSIGWRRQDDTTCFAVELPL